MRHTVSVRPGSSHHCDLTKGNIEMLATFRSNSIRRSMAFRVGAGLAVASLLLVILVGRNGSLAQPALAASSGPYESLGAPLVGFTIPATNVWADGGLLYALAVDGGTNTGPFMVLRH